VPEANGAILALASDIPIAMPSASVLSWTAGGPSHLSRVRLRAPDDEINALVHQLAKLGRLLGDARVRILEKETHLAQMEASTSWRLTAPLRGLIRRLPGRDAGPDGIETAASDAAPLAPPPMPVAPPPTPMVSPWGWDAPPVARSTHPPLTGTQRQAQRAARGLTLPVQDCKVSVAICAAQEAPEQLKRCLDSTRLALEAAGSMGEILLCGPEAVAGPSHWVEAPVGWDAPQAHNLLLREAFRRGAEVVVLATSRGMFHPQSIRALLRVLTAHDQRALVEATHFPQERPRLFDSVTLEVGWASSACLAIPRALFEVLDGFDQALAGDAADVDFSWRARAQGLAVLVAPDAMFLLPGDHTLRDAAAWRSRVANAVLLSRKWRAREFEIEALSELARVRAAVPTAMPAPIPEDWRGAADFAHQLSFSPVRWS
jgi:hypothetical protein